MRPSAIGEVITPKALAAAYVHGSKARVAVETLILFSSSGATLGNLGQANYSTANSFLDTLALCRRGSGLVASSLQPSNVSTVGMAKAANDAGRHNTSWSLGLEEYTVCLRGLLAGGCGIHLPWPQDLRELVVEGDVD